MSYIYKTTNLVNGKIYIGQHIGNRKNYLGSGKLIKRAIIKYGKENFSLEVLEYIENTDKELLDSRERFWIKFFNSTDDTIGYNICSGGQGGDISNKKGKTFIELYGEEKAKNIKEKYSKRVITASWIQNMISSRPDQRGDKNPSWKREYSKEARERMSDKTKGLKNKRVFIKSGNSSMYIGVDYRKDINKWRARINTASIEIYSNTTTIGVFETEIEAAIAYNEAAEYFYGYKARLNSIDDALYGELWI